MNMAMLDPAEAVSEQDCLYEAEMRHIAQFSNDNRAFIGHLVSLTIGGEALKADFNFGDPMGGATDKAPLCGAILFSHWNKKPGGDITIRGRVSDGNQGGLKKSIDAKDKTADVEIVFNWYKYNPSTKGYYKCFHTDDEVIKGELSRRGGSYARDIPADDYQQIINYDFQLVITGSDEENQDLMIAYNPELKEAFAFGQAVNAAG